MKNLMKILMAVLIFVTSFSLSEAQGQSVTGDVSSVEFDFYDIRKEKKLYFSAADGRPKVLIFGDTLSSYNTGLMIKYLAFNAFDLDQYDVYIIDTSHYTDEALRENIPQIDERAYYTSMYNCTDKSLYDLAVNKAENGITPHVLFIDGKGQLTYLLHTHAIFSEIATAMATLGLSTEYVDSVIEVPVGVFVFQDEARKELDMVNEFRTGDEAWYWNDSDTEKIYVDLEPLEWDYDLEKIAMQRAAELNIYYSHSRPDYRSCFTAYSDAGYEYNSAGENIAYGQVTAEEVVTGWREDNKSYSGQGHRRNMLGSKYTGFAAAAVYWGGTVYWVQLFSDKVHNTVYEESYEVYSDVFDVRIEPSNLFWWELRGNDISLLDGETVDLDREFMLYGKLLDDGTGCVLEDKFYSPYDLEWSVTDPSIARIDNGILSGINEGRTTITCYSPERLFCFEISVTVYGKHDWSDPKYEMIAHNTKMKAYKECPDCGVQLMEISPVKFKVIQSLSYNQNGIIRYSGAFSSPHFTDHDIDVTVTYADCYWETAVWEFESDYSSAMVMQTGYLAEGYKMTFGSRVYLTKKDLGNGKIQVTGTYPSRDGKTYRCELIIVTNSDGSYTVESEQYFDEETITRLYGDNRYDTSILMADFLKEELGVGQFDSVILASGTAFPDALAGSYLAARKNAPILLVNPKSEKQIQKIVKYINANVPWGATVYILGGESAVPYSVDAKLSLYNVVRLAGSNRYQTNTLILQEAGVDIREEILVCTGNNYADSLSVSSVGKPILLVGKNLSSNAQDFLASLKECSFTIIGGESAVSNEVATQLRSYGPVERISGKNRYETSTMVAERYYDDPESVLIAYGDNFPDGLCAGPAAHVLKAPVILATSKSTKMAMNYAEKENILKAYVIGGDSLISDDAVRKIFDLSANNRFRIVH